MPIIELVMNQLGITMGFHCYKFGTEDGATCITQSERFLSVEDRETRRVCFLPRKVVLFVLDEKLRPVKFRQWGLFQNKEFVFISFCAAIFKKI